MAGDRELKNKATLRGKQLLLDYPDLVTKVSLYMGAGMTVRMAFAKIAGDYAALKKCGGAVRFVYEELLIACHEIDSGVSETLAYDHFAGRCNLQRYYKFCAVLTQNLKKGSAGILPILRAESKDAFEERKAIAKRLGEEAGTKLLMPMMLMLVIVMVIIIVPAVMSFSM
jgi:hypothetical protein